MVRTSALAWSLLVFALGSSTVLAQSGTAVCYAIADTRLEQKAPNRNYGDATRANSDKLWATCFSGLVPGQLGEAALKFSLTDPAACNLPAGVVINAVRLKVNVGDPTVDRFGLYLMKKAWTERGATWSVTGNGANWQRAGANGTTSPGQDRDAILLGSLSNQTTGLKTVTFNTAGRNGVRTWQSSPTANHGILLRPYVGDPFASCDDHVWISSREAAARPRLEIDWSVPDLTAPTISNIVEGPGTTSATLQWTTNEGANGQVAFGTSVSYGVTTALSAGGLRSHSHTLSNLLAGQRYFYRITSKDAAGNARVATGDFVTATTSVSGPTFTIVSWNLQYGKGMPTRAAGMTCPHPGMKENAQCQIADNPATLVNEREQERKQSAWGIGLTQRYLMANALGDPEVIALLLTEVNGGTCFSQADLMTLVRTRWPGAKISPAHRDNWIVARWGFVAGAVNYAQKDLPPCGYQPKLTDAPPLPWPASYAEGIEWGRIYAEDPDPDGDGVPKASARTLNVFNAHWPLSGFDLNGNPFFCEGSATITRDFMASPATALDLRTEPRVLGGDINVEDVIRNYEIPSCEPYGGRKGYDILRAAGFMDAFVAAGTSAVTPTADGSTGMVGRPTTETCYRNYSHNGLYMPYKRIDVQWFKGGTTAGRNLRVLGFELIGVEQFGNCTPSDHMGTKVRYQWY